MIFFGTQTCWMIGRLCIEKKYDQLAVLQTICCLIIFCTVQPCQVVGVVCMWKKWQSICLASNQYAGHDQWRIVWICVLELVWMCLQICQVFCMFLRTLLYYCFHFIFFLTLRLMYSHFPSLCVCVIPLSQPVLALSQWPPPPARPGCAEP